MNHGSQKESLMKSKTKTAVLACLAEPFRLGKNQTNTIARSERKRMKNKFDELTKSLAQSVSRRAALKKFGVGLAGMALACLVLANKALAGERRAPHADCAPAEACCTGACGVVACACSSPLNQCCCHFSKEYQAY